MTQTHRRLGVKIAFAVFLPLALAACGGEDDAGSGDAPSPTTRSVTIPTIPQENLPAPVERAINNAAGEAGVEPVDVELIAFTEEQWNDTSLGCPQPDGVYAQVITPGFSVRLLIDGEEHEYHTDMDAAVVRCGA